MVPPSRLRRFFVSTATYAAIVILTLVVVDIVLIALKLFPPRYVPGDPELGWVTHMATGRVETKSCMEMMSRQVYRYTRNEDAVRSELTSTQLRAPSNALKIAVGGDSQTDLCASNAQTHFGVMEAELEARGIPAIVYARPAGKYSPLQAYLALKKPIADYGANALVLNVYTGNDVYDMLRLDDRPHFVKTGTGYRIAPPIWYQEVPPGTVYRSRVLFAARSVARATGLRNAWVRVRYLRDAAREQAAGFRSVFGYMNDLRKASTSDVGYAAAFSAQMLNQQLFFHHFPGSEAESLNRVRALLELIRREHPQLLLVLSPLPSYQLVQEQPVDSALLEVFQRMPFTYAESVARENVLYESLRRMAAESGWVFVDNLPPLRQYRGSDRLFNNNDYHFEPNASAIIGRAQAEAVANHLKQKGNGSAVFSGSSR